MLIGSIIPQPRDNFYRKWLNANHFENILRNNENSSFLIIKMTYNVIHRDETTVSSQTESKKMMNLNDVVTAKTSELLTTYNKMAEALGEKVCHRFADRETAERRVSAIIARYSDAFQPAVVEAVTEEKRTAAEGIAASWKDPEVAAKRMTRHTVICNGQEFKSVRQAFAAFGLNDKKHIAFRMKLKAAGKEIYRENGVHFQFALQEQY